jgi:hypothetical protein
MSDTTDTSTIDNKKSESSNKSGVNIPQFFTTLLSLIVLLIIHFSLGGLTLYACKLAQSNILPTEGKCFPYTNISKPKIDEILTNIFPTMTTPSLSMKLKFPYDEYNASNKILDLFRNYKSEPYSNFLMNYFIEIIESLILVNYSSLNFILNSFNGIPEILIVLFGPFLLFFSLFFVFLFNNLYVIYLWFASMGWFFKMNVNDRSDAKPKWESVSAFDPVNFGCAVGLVILFSCLVWLLVLGLPVLPFVTMMICLFTLVGYKSILNPQSANKSVNATHIIKDVFKYYKTTIMGIFSILVVISAFTNLGNIPGIISLVVLLLIYFGLVSVDLFKPINEANVTALVSNRQAKKSCVFNEPLKRKGILNYLLSGGAGTHTHNNIVKDLKKLAKQMNQ